MSDPDTAREAFFLEALGDMANLINRLEAIAPAMDASQRALVQASAKFSRQAAEQGAAFDGHIVQFTAKVKEHAVKHIAQRADEVTQRTLGLQVQAMEEAARTLFLKEVGPELRQLCAPLERLYAMVQENSNPWNAWLTHAATATFASLTTWAVTSGVLKP